MHVVVDFTTVFPVGDGTGAHHTGGQLSDGPRAHLQLVAGQLSHQALGGFAVESPVDQAFQLRRRHLSPPVAIAIPESMHRIDAAKNTLVYHLHHLDIARVEKALLPHEEHPPRVEMLAIDGQRFLHRIGDGLFAIDMLACVKGIHGNLEVRVEWRGNNDAINLLVLQQLAIVLISLRRRYHLQCLVERWLIDVGKSGDFTLGILGKETQ